MNATPLVLLHGQPGSAADWDPVIERLPVSLAAIALDRPGYATNPADAGGFRANADALIAELDRRHIERAVIAGHSYGGGVALATAIAAPERVEALVLVASVGAGSITAFDRLLAAPMIGEVMAISAWHITPRFARARLAHLEAARGGPLDADQYVYLRVWANARHDHGDVWKTFLIEQRAFVRELDALVEASRAITAPALVLADPKDPIVPMRTARELAETLPRARLEVIEGAGHHLPARAPAAVADAITRFLASHSAGTA